MIRFIQTAARAIRWPRISWLKGPDPVVKSSNVISINSAGVPVKHEVTVEIRKDSFGRICKRPDPVENPYFRMYTRAHGIERARAAFALWEDDHG